MVSQLNSPGAVVDIESMQFFRVGAKPVVGGIGQVMANIDQMIKPDLRGGSKRHLKVPLAYLN